MTLVVWPYAAGIVLVLKIMFQVSFVQQNKETVILMCNFISFGIALVFVLTW